MKTFRCYAVCSWIYLLPLIPISGFQSRLLASSSWPQTKFPRAGVILAYKDYDIRNFREQTYYVNGSGGDKTSSTARLFSPIRKALFRVRAFLQYLLGRIIGKERMTKLQVALRSITEKYTIYVLECERGKYYVGSTQNKKKRFYQHLVTGRGSVWTREYKPLRILKQYKRIPKAYALGLESRVTAEAMLQFGVNNVRGAMFCNGQNYTIRELDSLTRFIGHYNDLSYSQVRDALRSQLPSRSREVRRRRRAGKRAKMLSTDNATTTQVEPQTNETDKLMLHSIKWEVEEFGFSKRLNGKSKKGGAKENDVCWRCGRLGKELSKVKLFYLLEKLALTTFSYQKGHWAADCPY